MPGPSALMACNTVRPLTGSAAAAAGSSSSGTGAVWAAATRTCSAQKPLPPGSGASCATTRSPTEIPRTPGPMARSRSTQADVPAAGVQQPVPRPHASGLDRDEYLTRAGRRRFGKDEEGDLLRPGRGDSACFHYWSLRQFGSPGGVSVVQAARVKGSDGGGEDARWRWSTASPGRAGRRRGGRARSR